MILELFVLFELIMLSIFFTAFFTKQEILWGVSLVLSGMLMIVSYNIQISQYVFDPSIGAYAMQLTTYSFPFLMGLNMLFFALAVILGLFDFFDKYGISTMNFKKGGR